MEDQNVITIFRLFLNDESGVTAIEYGLIAALISVTLIVLLVDVGAVLNQIYGKIASCFVSPTTC